MTWVQVSNQDELDAAIKSRQMIDILAPLYLHIPEHQRVEIKSSNGARISVVAGSAAVFGEAIVTALNSAQVEGMDEATILAKNSSRITSRRACRVVAEDRSHVIAGEQSRVEAGYCTSVEASGTAVVLANGSAQVIAKNSATVIAYARSRVLAAHQAKVFAYSETTVQAFGDAVVAAFDRVHVTASDAVNVTANGTASLSLSGQNVRATAGDLCTVHLHCGAICSGGQQVVVPAITSVAEWCSKYGVTVENGNAVLYKGVSAAFKSKYGADYTPGTETIAADWDTGLVECGRGLHFSPTASATLEFASRAERFVRCLVPLELLVVHPNGMYPQKVKAKKCLNVCECDVSGNEIAK